MASLTPNHLVQLWEEHEEAGQEFVAEVPVTIKTKTINKGEFTCVLEIQSLAYDVDHPESMALKVCGAFVPWNPERKQFCNDQYCLNLQDINLQSELMPKPNSEETIVMN